MLNNCFAEYLLEIFTLLEIENTFLIDYEGIEKNLFRTIAVIYMLAARLWDTLLKTATI